MKSVLQEDSSVLKAIEKAWNITGRPTKFTIKIINNEEKNFWGIISKPALISLVYDPSSLTQEKSKIIKKSRKKEHLQKKSKDSLLDKFFKKGNEQKLNKQRKEFKYDKPIKNRKESDKNTIKKVVNWKKEYVNDAIKWIADLLNIMGIKTNIDSSVDQKMLNVFLQDSILQDVDAEKMLFINLSNIVMQFLRKKYKKKFSNYYLIIKHKNENKRDKSVNNK